MTLTVAFALAAALSSAVNLMTQHSASVGAPKREKGWRLVAYLFRQPLWLLGWIAAAGAFAFQAVALHYGQLSVVQPILVTELVFVLVLRRVWIRQDVARAAWAAALVVCGALAAFLAAAEPTGGHSSPETAEWLSALLVFGGAIAAAGRARDAGLTGTPGRPARGGGRVGVGPDGDVRQDGDRDARHVRCRRHAHALAGVRAGRRRRWPARCSTSPLCTSGRLSVSQPLLVIINPLASIILSVWLFDERFTDSPARIAIAVLAMAVLAVGVIALSRTAPQDLAPASSAPAPGHR